MEMQKIGEQIKILNDAVRETSSVSKLDTYREVGRMFGNLDTSTSKTIVVGVTNIMKNIKEKIEKLEGEVKLK